MADADLLQIAPGPAWQQYFQRGLLQRNPQPLPPATGSYAGTIVNTFEGGTNGVAISAANSGTIRSTAFTTVSNSGALAYDSTYAAHGGQSARLATAAPSGSTTWLRWTNTLGPQQQVWWRFYFLATQLPAAGSHVLFTIRDPKVASSSSSVVLNSTGTLSVRNSAQTVRLTTTNTVPLGQWVRIEGTTYGSATQGFMSLALYLVPDAAAATETVATGNSENTNGTIGTYEFGTISGQGNWGPYWYDDLAVSSVAPCGPAAIHHDFETAASGTTITAGPSGNSVTAAALGDTYFDAVQIGAGATLAYDSTVAAHGGQSLKVATANAVSVYCEWAAQLPMAAMTQPKTFYRLYLYFASLPANNTRIWAAYQGSNQCAALIVLSSGLVLARDAAGNAITTSSTAIPTGQWCRIEGWAWCDPYAGQVEFKIFPSPDSTVAAETRTSGATFNTFGLHDRHRFGMSGGGSVGITYWMDDIASSATGYIGPVSGTPAVSVPLQAVPGQAWRTQFQPWLSRPQYQGDTPPATAVIDSTGAALTGAGSVTSAATQGSGVSLTGAGSVSDVPATLGAGVTLTAGATVTAPVTQGAGVSLAGAGQVSGPAAVGATATVTATGSVTAPAVTLISGVTLTAAGTLTAPAVQGAGGTLTGAGTLSAPAVTIISGATLTGGGTVSATAVIASPATAAATGLVTALAAQGAGVTLTAAASTSELATQAVTAAVAAAGSVTALATQGAAAALTGTAAVTAPATLSVITALAGSAVITAPAVVLSPAVLAGAGTVTAAGLVTMTGAGSLAGAGTVTATPSVLIPGGASLASAALLSAPAAVRSPASLAGAGMVTSAAILGSAAALAAAAAVTGTVATAPVAAGTAAGAVTARPGVYAPQPAWQRTTSRRGLVTASTAAEPFTAGTA